jgi:1-acyl-sn-glycerol-3-phosphate acyltransferase
MIERALARLARIIAGASVRFTVPLEPPERQRVYFGNHTSHLDFILIWSALPAAARVRTRPVAGADYWMRGRLRRYLASRVFHAVLIERGATGHEREESGSRHALTRVRDDTTGLTHVRDDTTELTHMRGPMRSVTAIAEAMGEETSIIVFPEGTRSMDGELLPFRSGLYHLCQLKPGLELVPVYLDNMTRILPKGEVLPVPLLSRITFGAPLRMDPDEEKRAFLGRMREALMALRER